VSRPALVVRTARPDDLPALTRLWQEVRDLSGRLDRIAPLVSEDEVPDRLRDLADSPMSRVLVAVVDDEVAGMAVLTRGPYAPLLEQTAVHLHYLHVREDCRRRGVGQALIAAAVGFAEEVGAEHVVTSVLPQAREANRFYARLGFGPVVVRRSVPVSLLRRRLAAEGVASLGDRMLAKRRSLRRVRAAVARVGD
jgi:ribosomal protein S18 acetylase RimI-like enzyme